MAQTLDAPYAEKTAQGKASKKSLPLDLFALLGLLLSLFAFYPDIFLARKASLAGDHWQQHYPWAVLFATSLKQGIIPWWTPLIQAGFPIAAEGQIAVLYPPNLLLYALLPVKWAYSYQNVVHFLISGWGTYLYCRQMKLSPLAAWIGAFAFLFGTSYGGAYYNITSLKTLCWFPWILCCIEGFFGSGKWRFLLGMSVLVALSQLAGYLQVAAFGMVILGLYVAIRTLFFHERDSFSISFVFKNAFFFALAFGLGILIASPQIWLMFKLAVGSTRVNLTEDYAYVGSLFPGALSTIVYPMTQQIFRGACLYVGTLPILLTCLAFATKASRQTTLFKMWLTVGIISLLLALGEWSPLYIGIVKLTNFYSFRIPAKFLGFVCFGVAMLGAVGMQAILDRSHLAQDSEVKKGMRLYLWFAGISLFLLVGAYSFISVFGPDGMKELGENFVKNFIHGRSGHPHSLQDYLDRIDPFITAFLNVLRPWGSFWNIWCYAMMGLGLLFAIFLPRWNYRIWILGASVFLFADLWVFSKNDIQKDFGLYKEYEQTTATAQKLIEASKQPGFGRLYGMRGLYEELPLVPSTNMLYGIEDVGGYSPLISGRYFESIGQLGNVNDSNSAFSPKVSFVLDRLPLLDFLNVSHVLSVHALQHPDLQELARDSNTGPYLYQHLRRPRQAHFISREQVFATWEELKGALMAPGFDPGQIVLWEKEAAPMPLPESASGFSGFEIVNLMQSAHEHVWQVETQKAGYLVLSNSGDVGWSAAVNGKEVPIYPAYGLFQAIRLGAPGRYEVHFKYSPWKAE